MKIFTVFVQVNDITGITSIVFQEMAQGGPSFRLCHYLLRSVSSQQYTYLMQVGTPYLETYLQRRASQADDKVAALDMLWKHYEKTNNFMAAARILSQLSQRHG